MTLYQYGTGQRRQDEYALRSVLMLLTNTPHKLFHWAIYRYSKCSDFELDGVFGVRMVFDSQNHQPKSGHLDQGIPDCRVEMGVNP